LEKGIICRKRQNTKEALEAFRQVLEDVLDLGDRSILYWQGADAYAKIRVQEEEHGNLERHSQERMRGKRLRCILNLIADELFMMCMRL